MHMKNTVTVQGWETPAREKGIHTMVGPKRRLYCIYTGQREDFRKCGVWYTSSTWFSARNFGPHLEILGTVPVISRSDLKPCSSQIMLIVKFYYLLARDMRLIKNTMIEHKCKSFVNYRKGKKSQFGMVIHNLLVVALWEIETEGSAVQGQ